MSGISYASHSDHLVRANLWSAQLKEVLLDELMGTKYVDMITDFPDGDTLNIPSIGQAEVMDYAEGQGVKYTGMDTGNFTFTINKYKSSATYITEKMKQDSFYTSRLVSSFVPKQSRAIMKAMEIDIMALGPDGQTASNLNQINGADHRWVGSGTNEVINIDDFAKAKFALQKANVPMTNLVAIVDPTVEFALNKLVGTSTAISYNPKWEGIVKSGMSTGMRFVTNVMGFDVYMSQNLKSGIAETVNGKSTTVGVANLFFSATPDVLPYVGSIRQAPKVDSEYNKDFQREEYVTTCRYGFKLYRPENMVVVLTDTDQVA
jgi:hypothetical protein